MFSIFFQSFSDWKKELFKRELWPPPHRICCARNISSPHCAKHSKKKKARLSHINTSSPCTVRSTKRLPSSRPPAKHLQIKGERVKKKVKHNIPTSTKRPILLISSSMSLPKDRHHCLLFVSGWVAVGGGEQVIVNDAALFSFSLSLDSSRKSQRPFSLNSRLVS